MNKALFLDRDGTVIQHVHYLHKPEEVRLVPGMKEALETAQSKGYLLFLFTNQSGVGRGYFTLEEAEACNQEVIRQLGMGPEPFAGICIAPEAPGQPSNYRKPSPKFILEMIGEHSLSPNLCWMAGDNQSDLQAGKNAGIQSVFVHSGIPPDETTRAYISKESVPEFPSLLEFSESLPS